MDNDIIILLVPAFAAGILIGAANYAGLWLTVRRVALSSRPTLLVLASMAGRMALCLAAFYLVMDGGWEKLLACTAGFFLVRLIAVQRMKKPQPSIPTG